MSLGEDNNDRTDHSVERDDRSSVNDNQQELDQSYLMDDASAVRQGKSDNDSIFGNFENNLASFDVSRNKSSIVEFLESSHLGPILRREASSSKGMNDNDSMVSDLPDPLMSDTNSIRQASVGRIIDNDEEDDMNDDLFKKLQELNSSGLHERMDDDPEQSSLFDDLSAKKDGESIFGTIDNVLQMLPDTIQRDAALAAIEEAHQQSDNIEKVPADNAVADGNEEQARNDSNESNDETKEDENNSNSILDSHTNMEPSTHIESIEQSHPADVEVKNEDSESANKPDEPVEISKENQQEVLMEQFVPNDVEMQNEGSVTTNNRDETGDIPKETHHQEETELDFEPVLLDLFEHLIENSFKVGFEQVLLEFALANEIVDKSVQLSVNNAVEHYLQSEREENVEQVKNLVEDNVDSAIFEALSKSPKKTSREVPIEHHEMEIAPAVVGKLEEPEQQNLDDATAHLAQPKFEESESTPEPIAESDLPSEDCPIPSESADAGTNASPQDPVSPEVPNQEEMEFSEDDKIEPAIDTESTKINSHEISAQDAKTEKISENDSNAKDDSEPLKVVETDQLQLQIPNLDNDGDTGPPTNTLTNDGFEDQNRDVNNDDNLFGEVDNFLMESKDVDSFLQNQLEELEKSDDLSVESSKSEMKKIDRLIVSFRHAAQKLDPVHVFAEKLVEKLLTETLHSELFVEKYRKSTEEQEDKHPEPEPEESNEVGVTENNIESTDEEAMMVEKVPEDVNQLELIHEMISSHDLGDENENTRFSCINQLPLEQQKTIYNLFSLLVRENFLSLMENSIPTLTKEMENEFSVLSAIFDDMNNFHYTHLRGISSHNIPNEKPSIIEYDETKYIDDGKKQELVKILKKAENRLKKRLSKLTEISKALYDSIDTKVHRLRQVGKYIDSVSATKVSPKRKTTSQLKFSMTDVIDYLRDPVSLLQTKLNAVYESEIKPKETIVSNKLKATYSQLLNNIFTLQSSNNLTITSPKKDSKAERAVNMQHQAQKHLHHRIEKFISTKIRYKESISLKQKAKRLLERHLEEQLKKMNGLMNKINRHYDPDELVLDQISDVSDEEGNSGDRLDTQVQQGRIRPRKKSKSKKTDDDPPSPFKAKPYKLPDPKQYMIPEPFDKYRTIKENRMSVANPTSDVKRDKELSRLFQLCQGLDLENPNHAYNLKEPLPSSKSRPKSAGRMSTAELQTAAKKLGYMKFDIYEEGKTVKHSSSTPFIENMLFKPEKETNLPRDVIALYQFSPKRAAKIFKHHPIDKKAKQKLVESNRVSKLSPTRNGDGNEAKGNSKKTLMPVESESTYNLEEIIMGKKSTKKKASPKKVPGTPVIFELDSDEKLLESEEKSSGSKVSDSKGAKSHKQLTSAAKSTLSLFALAAEEAEVASRTSRSINYDNIDHRADSKRDKYIDKNDRELLEVLDGPVLWDGNARSPTATPTKMKVMHDKPKPETTEALYDQASLDPMEINSLVEVGAKITEIFEERGIINDGELLNQKILYVQVDSAYEKLQSGDEKFDDSEELLQEEVSELSKLTVSLMDDLNGFVNEELIRQFHMKLHQSKLLRKEVEIELMETFWSKSLEYSRLRDLGMLSIPADVTDAKFFEHPIHPTDPKKSLKLNDHYDDDEVLELSREIDEGFALPTPFRIGGDKLRLSSSTKEGILASHPRTLLEQQLDYHLHNIAKLRKHLRVSLYNLLEITMADALHVNCYLLVTEMKHLKMRNHYRTLRSKLLQSPSSKIGKADETQKPGNELQKMLDDLVQNEEVRSLVQHSFLKYGLEDYVVEKCKLKCRFLNHGIKQLKTLTEECLKEAKETSKLLI